jgi:hypothetical protein
VDGVSSLLLFHAILLAGSGAALSLISLSDFPGPRHRPPEVGLQEQASNRPVLLRSKGVVVNN